MNTLCKRYLFHSAGPKIEEWGTVGSEEFKNAKHLYNVGYYQRNKHLWDKAKDTVKQVGEKVGTMANVYKDIATVTARQMANTADYGSKVFDHGGQSDLRDFADAAVYKIRTMSNTIKYNYLANVATGNSSIEGYKFLRNLSTNVATMAKKVSDVVTSAVSKIKDALKSLFS